MMFYGITGEMPIPEGSGGKMKTKEQRGLRMAANRLVLLIAAVVGSALACNGSSTPAASATPLPGTIPPGWICYTNTTYGFQFCYPSDATYTPTSPEHGRITFPVAPGTNLSEKWMDVDAGSGGVVCESPQAASYSDPAAVHPIHQNIAGLDFLVQNAGEGAAGNFYTWTGYSTQRASVCASLTGVVHTTQALNYPTPPPTVDPVAESAVFLQITGTFRWLDVTPTPAITATIPPGWVCYTNTLYAFQVCYPSEATLSGETPSHVRINFPVAAGTNLLEKWMDVDGSSGAAVCQSPQAAGVADPSVLHPTHQPFAGLDFLVQNASEGAAGSFYDWTGYSTQRASVCASLTGVVHTADALNYPTPPPTVDPAAESTLFPLIVATFRWLAVTPAPATTATIPPGWVCYTNTQYAFQVCYPSEAVVVGETPAHLRIRLPFTPGTDLQDKFMDIDGTGGAAVCQIPLAQPSDAPPIGFDSQHQNIAGLDFLLQTGLKSAGDGLNKIYGYSTQRNEVCASLTGILRWIPPDYLPTPLPEFDEAAESAVFGQIAATFRWLDVTPTATGTATIPPGWVCYTNTAYAFQVCYPADATLSDETPAHVRIHLTIAPGTNLHEKWMDVDGTSGAAVCQSPQAAGYDPSAVAASHRLIAGLDFLVQSAGEGAAGNIYQWTGYSTQRVDVCASLTGVLHSVQPGNYPTPPPEFDQAAESWVFDEIAATFRWLAPSTPTPTVTATPTPAATPTATPTPTVGLQFLNAWISADRFYFRGDGCGPMQVQFQIAVSQPALVGSVGIFFQLKDKSTGKLSGWSKGYAMSPLGSGKYFFTLLTSELMKNRSLDFKEAWLQYQFVANDKNGAAILYSNVFENITLAYCGSVTTTGK
jgi:hypothetical protein